jgi:hypothetical protein
MSKGIVLAGLVLSLAWGTALAATNEPSASPDRKAKVVIQVSEADTGKWHLAFNNARNIQSAYGAANVDIEIVAYGPGVSALKVDTPLAGRLHDAKAAGVRVEVCENTMVGMGLHHEDMAPDVQYVPSGAAEIVGKQLAGYAYLRP